MNKKRIFIITGICIALIIAAIGTRVYVLKWKDQWNAEIAQNTPLDKSELKNEQESKKEIDISNWKTYRDDKYKFEIKYPYNWEFDEFDGKSFFIEGFKEVNRIGISEKSKKLINSIDGDYMVNISVYSNKKIFYTTLNDWRKFDINNAIDNKEEYFFKKYSFSNDEVLVFKRKKHNNENIGITSYYFFNNNDGYEITSSYFKDSNGLTEKIIMSLNFDK